MEGSEYVEQYQQSSTYDVRNKSPIYYYLLKQKKKIHFNKYFELVVVSICILSINSINSFNLESNHFITQLNWNRFFNNNI